MPSYESLSDVDEDDPKSMDRWLKGMRGEMGGEFGGDMEEIMHEMDSDSEGLGTESDDLD